MPEEYAEWFKQGSSGEGDFPPLADVRAVAERVQPRCWNWRTWTCRSRWTAARLYSELGGALMFTLVHRGWHTGKIMTLRALVGKPVMF